LLKGLVIVNPSSGKQQYQKVALMAAHRLLSTKICTDIHLNYTRKKGDAYDFAYAPNENEYDFIIAVGGDGTINEVINGILDKKSNIPLAIIPAGTSNDFATIIGLPKDEKKICKMIEQMNVEIVDVGKFNDTYFLNVVAGGILPEIAHKVSIEAKTYFGKFAYYLEGVKDISNLRLDTVPLLFEYDGKSVIEDVFLFIISNSTSAGGFQNIAPKAKLNDGLFDVFVLKKVEPYNILSTFMQIATGQFEGNNKISYFQTSKITISGAYGDVKFPLDYDGENGDNVPITIEVIPSAIKLVVPLKNKKFKLFKR